tara:strand:- start:426 stop:1055 length:630 start_codon:yes stop_codon:yes gene_type:complete
MALVLNGSANTIGGLAVGGLPDGIVDTDMLAADAVTGVKQGAGSIIQVVNSLNTYSYENTGAANTEYTVLSASGTDWDTAITINQGNKVFVSLTLNVAKSSADANIYFDIYYKVDSGSYAKVAEGNTHGSRSKHFGNVRSYGHPYNIEESSGQALITPSISGSTGVITFQVRVTQRAANNRAILINHTEQDNSEGGTTVSSLTAMEVVA